MNYILRNVRFLSFYYKLEADDQPFDNAHVSYCHILGDDDVEESNIRKQAKVPERSSNGQSSSAPGSSKSMSKSSSSMTIPMSSISLHSQGHGQGQENVEQQTTISDAHIKHLDARIDHLGKYVNR